MTQSQAGTVPLTSLYQTLLNSQRTSAFADLIRRCDDIHALLEDPNDTYTVWAPANGIIPSALAKGSEDEIRQFLLRHMTRIMIFVADLRKSMINIPVMEQAPRLNGNLAYTIRPIFHPQLGPTFVIDGKAHIVESDVRASNGLVHILDAYIDPLPTLSQVVESLPTSAFSMLQSAVKETNFEFDHERGATFFAPTNEAFRKRGSPSDPKTLEAMLRAHYAPNWTLYSNFFYKKGAEPIKFPPGEKVNHPIGERVFTLENAEGKELPINFWRRLRFVDMTSTKTGAMVISADHMASDGVVHIVDDFVDNFESA